MRVCRTAGERRQSLAIGSLFGLGLQALGPMVLFPLFKIARPAWKSTPAENLIDIGTHVIYGVAVQLVTEEALRRRSAGDRRISCDISLASARGHRSRT